MTDLSPDDQVDLTWFFGPAVCRFSRSNCGDMLERLERLGRCSAPCSACGGTGVRWDWVPRVDEWVDSHGARQRDIRWLDENGKRHDGNECPRCRGTAAEPAPMTRTRPSRTGYRRCHACHGTGETVDGDGCRTCGGDGYRVAEPAFAIHGPLGGAGVQVDDSTLQRSARISRRLAVAASSYAPAPAVLQALYDDEGLRWAGQGRRLFAIYRLTAAGRDLCHQTQSLRAARAALEGATLSRETAIKELLTRSSAEATELLNRTVEAWRGARGTRESKPSYTRCNTLWQTNRKAGPV